MNDLGVERWVGIAAGLTVGIAVLYFMYGPRIPAGFFDFESEPEPAAEAPMLPPAEPMPAPQRPVESADQGPKYPVPEAPAAAPQPQAKAPPAVELPPSEDVGVSDAEVRSASAQVFGTSPVESFLIPDRIIQNFVATVDSLDRDPIPLRFRVVQHVPEVPVVETKGDQIFLHSDNDERYRLLADTLRATEARPIANLYLRYYPLLQRAYREMGYPNAHFNDRLVQVIDHLLATPEVEHPIPLVRGKVLYQFADPALEELSSGQKIMIRIGPANATIAKQRLRELREIITSGKPVPSAKAGTPPPQARKVPSTPAPVPPVASQPAEAEPVPPMAAQPAGPEPGPQADAAAMEASEPQPAAEPPAGYAPDFTAEPEAQEITPVPPLRELEEGKDWNK